MLDGISDGVAAVGGCVSEGFYVCMMGVSHAVCAGFGFFPAGIVLGFSWCSNVAWKVLRGLRLCGTVPDFLLDASSSVLNSGNKLLRWFAYY